MTVLPLTAAMFPSSPSKMFSRSQEASIYTPTTSSISSTIFTLFRNA